MICLVVRVCCFHFSLRLVNPRGFALFFFKLFIYQSFQVLFQKLCVEIKMFIKMSIITIKHPAGQTWTQFSMQCPISPMAKVRKKIQENTSRGRPGQLLRTGPLRSYKSMTLSIYPFLSVLFLSSPAQLSLLPLHVF